MATGSTTWVGSSFNGDLFLRHRKTLKAGEMETTLETMFAAVRILLI